MVAEPQSNGVLEGALWVQRVLKLLGERRMVPAV
jgi:hypothetical protein